ncbi:ABC transporter substrate-binding protein [Paeniroseomonas aquatica]|uniref:ABC transporter substrate-binding protein n=1 Tax=Paeniroseomonas aquatica TaxID=373043 RepID=A0ABT8AAV3_9PROT|nr:ABC transporter substrate-binding protein [Paeniroseomonas aquatica]MDN3566459.1 ABC transporter substrate-binding protein [Paeniroseomonas aquatica]
MTRRTLLAASLLLLTRPALAEGPSPAGVVDRLHATLLDLMRNARSLGVRGREQRLRPVMQAAFNLAAMTRIAVGPPWTGLPEAQQQALVAAFSDWSIATYASRFDGFGGESFETLGTTPRPNGDVLVNTRLNRPSDAPVLLNYLLRDGRIVDVYLTGTISELASRRAEFTAILREGGADRLVAELRRRTATALAG